MISDCFEQCRLRFISPTITITGFTPSDYGISYFNDKRSSVANAPEIDFPFVAETIATNKST